MSGHSADSNRVDSYFICGTPRTGSSLLLGLLDSSGVAGHPQAYFRAPDEPLWAERWGLARDADGGFSYADYVTAALAAGRSENGVFGAKLMWGTLDDLVVRLAALYPDLAGSDDKVLARVFGRTRFVYLRRDDVLAQAVSWLRAEQTNNWFAGGNGEISGPGDGSGVPRYDAEAIRRLLETIHLDNLGWQRWFAAHDVVPLDLRYEELDADSRRTALRVLDFLGLELPDGRELQPRHRRQADKQNAEWVRRYKTQEERPGRGPSRHG